MSNVYFTICGLNHYYGSDFLKEGMAIRLKKEPDNEVDNEAIRVELEGLGRIGYVANSTYTRVGESMSAGRLYDRIGDIAYGKVVYILDKGAVCLLDDRDEQEELKF